MAGLLLLLLASAVYPLVGTYARTDHYMQRTNSLDGIAYLQTCKVPDCDYDTSGDYYAIRWLNNGLNAADFDNRKSDVDTIYTDPHQSVVMNLLARYHVRYLYVGLLEQMKYPTANLHRFSSFLHSVYSANGVTIYQVG